VKQPKATPDQHKQHLIDLAEAYFAEGEVAEKSNRKQAELMAMYQILSAVASKGTPAEVRAVSQFFSSVAHQSALLEQAFDAVNKVPYSSIDGGV